jgi:hypothetical protein
MPQQWRHGKTIGHSGWTKGMYDRFSIAAHVKPPGYIVSSFYVPESYG